MMRRFLYWLTGKLPCRLIKSGDAPYLERYYLGNRKLRNIERAGAVRVKQNTSFAATVVGPVDRRNKRSVWTIASQPFGGAHFATFPEALVEPCILAGSRAGDIVLDPFFGSGTVGAVAQNLGRRWIGSEINPEYARLAQVRTAQQGLVIDDGACCALV